MPRMAKLSEKYSCIRRDFKKDVNRCNQTLCMALDHHLVTAIEEALEEGYIQLHDLSQFADVKEVPKWEI